MEGSAEDVHLEKAAGSPGNTESQPGRAEEAETDRQENPQRSTMDDDGEALSIEEEGSSNLPPHNNDQSPEAAGVGLSVSDSDPALGNSVRDSPSPPGWARPSFSERECHICFNRYGPHRPPKVLACQHVFCAVCLKLILRHDDQAWIIVCPLCRRGTVVFGGLVCSLQDKEEVATWTESLALETRDARPVPHLPDRNSSNPPGNHEGTGGTNNRSAAKRLVLLLLLVAILVLLIVPFLYSGMLKWALCFVVLLGLVLSVVLCCDPRRRCSGADVCPWQRKESQVSSIA